ncbi:MAG: hypothetical protein Nk1A_6490 [Endomicrobiia bacterium]|nr:MAG: hypothetical protein Nk1A_6490 [Endomicrobiia bacterium]
MRKSLAVLMAVLFLGLGNAFATSYDDCAEDALNDYHQAMKESFANNTVDPAHFAMLAGKYAGALFDCEKERLFNAYAYGVVGNCSYYGDER